MSKVINGTKVLAILFFSFLLSGCTKTSNVNNIEKKESVAEVTTSPTVSPKKEENISFNKVKTYTDSKMFFSFSYPEKFVFEETGMVPGGTIKDLSFRVDGITDSQLLSKDLEKSLMSNDLYCNLDNTNGGAVCTNEMIEAFTNKVGTKGYKISRKKDFYEMEDESRRIMTDTVYAFPLLSGLKTEAVSGYKVIVFSVKYPSEINSNFLNNLIDTVIVN